MYNNLKASYIHSIRILWDIHIFQLTIYIYELIILLPIEALSLYVDKWTSNWTNQHATFLYKNRRTELCDHVFCAANQCLETPNM